MIREPELLQKIVDAVQETGTIKNACRACGVSYSSAFAWMKASSSAAPGDDEFMVSVGDERLMFHEAVKLAQRQVSFEILENFRHKLLHGTYEVARFQGKTVFQRHEELDGWSDAEIRELGLERYKRDPVTGEFLPELIHHEPSTQAVLAFLAAEYPKQWGNKVEINQRSTSTGVTVVKHQFAPKPLAAAVQEIAPLPAQPVVAFEAPVEVKPEEIEPESHDLSDILGEAVAVPQTEPAPSAALPITPPTKQLSELERDLLARLGRAPAVPVGRPEADDLDPRRTVPTSCRRPVP